MKNTLIALTNKAKKDTPTINLKPTLSVDEQKLMDYIQADEEPVEQPNPWQGQYDRRTDLRD